MSRPDQPGEEPHQTGAGSGGPPTGEDRPEYPPAPAERPWDWAIDPAPPEGPSQQPVPDPAAGRTVDEIPDPLPPGVGAPPPSTLGTPAPPGPAPGPPTAPPPDWSTPDTPANTPPLGGYPGSPQWPGPPVAPGPPGPPVQSGPAPGPQPPGPATPAPNPARSTDRRWWFVLGIVAALLSCCCVAAAVIALAWGPDFYTGLRERERRIVGLNQPIRDGDLEFRVRQLRCGLTEVGDPLVSQLALGQFCVVDLTVRNLGARPAVFHDNLQIAYGPAGQRFGVDSTAGLLANADQRAFLDVINPGNRVTGAIVYDIPPDARIVRLRLHGSATSAGVQIRTG
ncbi:DUF4352 domain-containing protein [Plantactinospora soyae]|uniref:DUF4352 domain-containing protein n=1 Tax=Plantactinospora soyae TaxID=1544732 RepID=A0A927M0H1_9ACTN|nr:DUF4352 domain-containing protein [Plantactinospora soyae]MBE1485769.1 hypothetical protein [Plantactinospora soyae]